MQNETVLQIAISQSLTWENAVDDFIACTTQIGQSFTSGHITTILRVYRPELRFKHSWIGERCQNKFYQQDFNYRGTPAVQLPRVCAGLGRTPAGTTVFVYGPDVFEAAQFPFELDIPLPGMGLTQMPQEHPIQNVQLTPQAPNSVDMRAKVHNDFRLCVPRIAIEALMHHTQRSFTAGDQVWVRFDTTNDKLYVSLDSDPNAHAYDISTERGRVLIPKPTGTTPFQHGDIFAITIENNDLVVDIGHAL